ncbi:NAD-P-binding protein [Multifurca ochricompacta]|uniref:NAD-P-binding protein n=1 Tax=Multifurca ochricompacta TaxID=376703 RepID=A0AAD4QLV9_9AGAM|nr:NAD-P-binding protein [Multifurca ochricompacta]
MSGFKNFTIAGSGVVGDYIIRELLKLKEEGKIDKVTILTRSDSSSLDQHRASGVTITVVNYGSAESLKNAVTGSDVVISTVGHGAVALQAQHLLAEQAKAAGVKLFVPSEFGHTTDRENPKDVFALKQSVHHKLKELDLPYSLFFTGPHLNYVFVPAIGLDLKSGNVTAGLDGNALNSFTAQSDIGRFVAYVLTQLPRSKLEWRTFRIEAERKSFNQIFKEYEEKTGTKLNVTYRSESELKAALKKNPADFAAILQLDWGHSGGLVGRLDQLSVSEYPDWNPKSIADVVYS